MFSEGFFERKINTKWRVAADFSSKSGNRLFIVLKLCDFVRFFVNYAIGCDLRPIMRNRTIASYQKACLKIRYVVGGRIVWQRTIMSANCQWSYSNRPFPNCLMPLFQSEASCKTFHMEMSFVCMWSEAIHQASLWKRGTRQLGNGLLQTAHLVYTVQPASADSIVHPLTTTWFFLLH